MKQQQAWPDQVRDVLDASARDIDAASLSRLNRARQRALLEASVARRMPRLWLAGLATAGALVVAVVLSIPQSSAPTGLLAVALQPAGTDENELVVDDDNLDMVQDLEFYAWLDTQEDDVNG